jgi:iron complex outermembrane receptor protein
MYPTKKSASRGCTIAGTAIVATLVFPDAGAQTRDGGELQEIVVTATPLPRAVEQLAQPVSVLTGTELVEKLTSSLGETLSQEAGMSSTHFGPVASRPVIRGQGGERVRILADGLDTLDASALSVDHQISADAITTERIEVIKGPATLLYGSGAAGGLINVVSNRIVRKPLEDGPAGAITLGADTAADGRSGAARVAGSTGRFGWHVDGFTRSVSDLEIPGFAESALLRAFEEKGHGEENHESEEEEAFGVVENSDGDTSGGAVGFSWIGDRGFIGIAGSFFDSDYGIPGGHGHGEEDEGEEHEEEEGPVRIDLQQTRIDLEGGLSTRGWIEEASFKLGFSDYGHVELEGDEIGTTFDTTGIDSRVELRHRPTGGWEGVVGFQHSSVDFSAAGDEAFVPPSDTRQTSVFAFEEYILGDATTLQASARIERQSIDPANSTQSYSDTGVGAGIGLVHALTPGLTFSANLAYSQRHPTAAELYADGAHVAVRREEFGSVTLGNGLLGVETSTSLDLTLRGKYKQIEWFLTGFINDVSDYISLIPTGEEDEFPIFEYRQTDASFVGFEAESRIELIDNDVGHPPARLFSDFVFAEQGGAGDYLPRIPPLRYGLGFHYTRGGLSMELGAMFHADQDKFAAGELPTEEYTLVTVKVGYQTPIDGLYVFARGTNLSDEDARQHASPLKDTVPLAGRSLHIGLRYDF